jgi:plastocyanin
MRRLAALGTVGALLSLAAACGGDDDGGNSVESAGEPVAGATEIEVTGQSNRFDPEEITVAAGEDFTIAFTAVDILHDFTLETGDERVQVDASRGETSAGGFKVEEPGEYTFYCTVPGHRDAGMEGTLTAE